MADLSTILSDWIHSPCRYRARSEHPVDMAEARPKVVDQLDGLLVNKAIELIGHDLISTGNIHFDPSAPVLGAEISMSLRLTLLQICSYRSYP